MKVKIMLLACLLLPLSAFSGNLSTDVTEIVKVENWTGSETLYIRTSQSQLTNPKNCPITDKYWLSKDASAISRSIILTAYVAKLSIEFTISGDICGNDRPMIVEVSLGH